MPSAIHPAIPDSHGQFGPYGGRYMPETLIPALDELERSFKALLADDDFWRTFRGMLADYVGRPSPLFLAQGISQELGGAQVYLKREDLNHTGAHKINNCLGQILLARRMGKRRIVADTGVPDAFGQRQVMAVTGHKVAARLGDADDGPSRLQFLPRQAIVEIALDIDGGHVGVRRVVEPFLAAQLAGSL
jgi:tryptophan synthase beta subunit